MKEYQRKSIQVGVIGKERIDPNNQEQQLAIQEAYTLGKLLAERGITVVSGGLGGVMNAVSKGVAEKNGVSVGIIPHLDEKEVDERKVSEFLTVRIPTQMNQRMRIPLVISCCDAVIALSGGTGTWLEAGFAYAENIPVICLPKTGGVAQRLCDEHPFNSYVQPASNAEDAITILDKILN